MKNDAFVSSVVFLLLFSLPAKGRNWYKKIDSEGYIAIGVEAFDGSYTPGDSMPKIYDEEVKRIGKAKIEYTIYPKDNISAVFDLRGDIDDPGIGLGKGYIQFTMNSLARIRLGYQKKNLGIEEMEGREDLYTINRSLINELFESFLMLENDMMIQTRMKHSTGTSTLTYSIGGGSDGDFRIFGNASMEWENDWGILSVSDLYAHHKNLASTNIVTFGYRKTGKKLSGCFELSGGKDPNRSDLLKRIGESRSVFFVGARALVVYGFRLNTAYVYKVEPLFGSVYLKPDIEQCQRNVMQLVPGVNIHFDDDGHQRWMNNIEMVFGSSNVNGALKRQHIRYISQFFIAW